MHCTGVVVPVCGGVGDAAYTGPACCVYYTGMEFGHKEGHGEGLGEGLRAASGSFEDVDWGRPATNRAVDVIAASQDPSFIAAYFFLVFRHPDKDSRRNWKSRRAGLADAWTMAAALVPALGVIFHGESVRMRSWGKL